MAQIRKKSHILLICAALAVATFVAFEPLRHNEFVSYDEVNRQALTLGTVSAQSVDNSANKAAFTISADASSIGGAFICTDNTKSGTSGILYGIGAFDGGNKAADDDDTLNVTATLSASAS